MSSWSGVYPFTLFRRGTIKSLFLTARKGAGRRPAFDVSDPTCVHPGCVRRAQRGKQNGLLCWLHDRDLFGAPPPDPVDPWELQAQPDLVEEIPKVAMAEAPGVH